MSSGSMGLWGFAARLQSAFSPDIYARCGSVGRVSFASERYGVWSVETHEVTVRRMLACLRDVQAIVANVPREEFLSDEWVHFDIVKAIVCLGQGVRSLPAGTFYYGPKRATWWARFDRLSWGLRGGYSQLDWAYLWRAISDEWPDLERELAGKLDGFQA